MVVGVGADAIAEQVAVVVIGVGLPVDAGQAVGGIVDVCIGHDAGVLSLAVAGGVVGVVEVAAIVIINLFQPVEGVILVGDGGGAAGGNRPGKSRSFRRRDQRAGIAEEAVSGRVVELV